MDLRHIALGNRSLEEWEYVMGAASRMGDIGARIQFLSAHFLGTDYVESTLIGTSRTREVFVVDFQRVDCMTFIEYVAAMSRSSSFPEFLGNLKRVRYKSGIVDFYARNHFFSDWRDNNNDYIEDVTEGIGGMGTVRVLKKMNEKEDGTAFIEGIQPVDREISFIPSAAINGSVIDGLKAGDYIGIYSREPGLDVFHTGLFVRYEGVAYFRHAASKPEHRKVIDQHFREYVAGNPGIVIFRSTLQQ